MATITLTTDFGTRDWFVGTMKGAITSIDPKANVVDISHEIPAGDIRAGAFVLLQSYRWFPRQTIHVAVVDPGVGTERRAIAVRTAQYLFVGPDNGVLSLALEREKIQEIRLLDNSAHFLQPVSATFHGRDIFAPVAARLGLGLFMESLGTVAADHARCVLPKPQAADGVTKGEVIYIDRFGNAITNVTAAILPGGGRGRTIRAGGAEAGEVRKCYHDAPLGQPLGLIGSTGFLEIAVNGGRAADALRLKVGDVVEVG